MPYKLRFKDWEIECATADEVRALIGGPLPSGARSVSASHVPADRARMNGSQSTTLKEHVVNVLREQSQPRFLKAREIWDLLKVRGVQINSDKQPDIIANTVRSSMNRHQGIFAKDGSRIGLAEWKNAEHISVKSGR